MVLSSMTNEGRGIDTFPAKNPSNAPELGLRGSRIGALRALAVPRNQRFRGRLRVVHGRKLAYIHGQKMTCTISNAREIFTEWIFI